MAAWSGYTPPSTVAAPASSPSSATASDAGWTSYNPTSAPVSSGNTTSTTNVSAVDAAWEPYPGTGSNGGSGGNLPPPMSQFEINQLVENAAALLSALQGQPVPLTQAMSNWLSSLPTVPQGSAGWWNDGGIAVYS